MDLPDGLTGPNDQAYVKTETRTGPPLDYVAEKLRLSIEGLHRIHQGLKDCHDNLFTQAHHSFHTAVTAYLALKNLLGMATDQDLFERFARAGLARVDVAERPLRFH